MSPILDLQQRAQEIGRIRLGVQRRTDKGKVYPAKLDTFRFTTASQRAAEAVAAYLGGTCRRWEGAPAGEQWEVLSTAREIPVAVPPGDAVISQWYELWTSGGCRRRCDGVTETISGRDCLCPKDPQQRAAAASGNSPTGCKMTTRVNVIIPDLPGLGVWRLESHGYYAAVELAGAAQLLGAARGQGLIVPAVLRMEQRRRKYFSGDEQVTRDFPVPVLEVLSTLRDLTELAASGQRTVALPPAPGRAITAGPAAGGRQQPAAAALPTAATRPHQRVAERTDGPGSAQACAELVRTITDPAELTDLGRLARGRGWMDEHVADADDVHEPLVDVFRTRRDELDRATREPAPAPAAAPAGRRGGGGFTREDLLEGRVGEPAADPAPPEPDEPEPDYDQVLTLPQGGPEPEGW